MADVPVDCEFPVWGLLPKKETGVVSFLNKNATYDGRDTIIAIFDSGVDPAASGLKVTSTGETKVIERFDCSGCGDVDTTTCITKVVDGFITGLTGRKLKIPETWDNPCGEWRVGVLYPFALYPTKLKERMQEHRKEHRWNVGHKPALAKASKELQDFESKNPTSTTLSVEDKLQKEELEARVDVLQMFDKKYNDVGPTYDCVLFHDGTVWRACIDTSETGALSTGPFLGEYSKTHEHSHLTPIDEMTISINVHDQGDTLEVVGMCSTHGTHVAAIASGYFPDEPEKNGVAPGAKVVSLTIGDSRLGSMETGTALVRACIKVMELANTMKIDVINMSYGEHAHWSNAGRIGDLISEVVNCYGVSWVVSAGNHGPALCTVGAPPDIEQSVLVGVGAYVSPEMMQAAYSMRAKVSGGAFSWSSRGPAADGAMGVSVCAPGGAVASVARFTLRNSQLMNGTSMAAPHVAGAVAVLISGLKAKCLPYSPYSLKRAMENSANYLCHVEPWAQGCGLLNVEKAFDILTTYHDAAERDVDFDVRCCNNGSKGILLRPTLDDVPKDVGISVEPHFLQSHLDVERDVNKDCNTKFAPTEYLDLSTDDRTVIPKQISFGMRLALACDAAWISAPAHLDMMNANRPLAVRIDCSGLPSGAHFTSINAYDVSCVEKGPVFRVPVTVFQPERLSEAANAPQLSAGGVAFRPSTIRRHFVVPPPRATWAVLRITTEDADKTGRFLIHTMQILPRKSCCSQETQKMVTLTSEAPVTLPFSVVGGVTLEVVIAKYWANLGDMTASYSVTFHGVTPDFGRTLTFRGADGVRRVSLAALRQTELQPSASLKYNEPVVKPTESKISPLTSRDVIPPCRQIYQLINTYTFNIAKACEMSPIVSLLCDMLYESEFESQMWMLYNTCKQLIATGDAYPSKYSVKVEKGEYTLRLNVRHENRSLLEKLQELPVTIQQRLQQPITLDVYSQQHQAITGGKKFSTGTVGSTGIVPLFLTGVPNDKVGRSNLTIGQTLTGTITFAKDELARKVDTYELQYVVTDTRKSTNSSAKDKEKTKPNDEYLDALKEFKTTWLGKLEGTRLDQVYEQLVQSAPGYLGAHVAYLHGLDPPSDPKKLPHADQVPDVTVAWCEQIVTIADKVIKNIDQEKLLAYLGLKNDTRPDASKIKQENEKQRGYLIDALCRKGTALCLQLALAEDAAAQEKLLAAVKDNAAELMRFTDLSDTKAIHYGIWHCYALKHWGRALKLLSKLQEERPSREADERLAEAALQLGWEHVAAGALAALPARHPTTYRPF